MQAWLPDAMEAPTPISAYLHAASMVKVGVYIFARAIIDGGNIPHVIGGVGMVMALVTILYGFLMYLPQQDMKRLLARSTITQLGWMFFGLSLSIFGSRLAEGSIAYIVNHAFAKSLFFLVAGALSYSCGTRLLPRLRGVLHTLPLRAWVSAWQRWRLPAYRRSTASSVNSRCLLPVLRCQWSTGSCCPP